MSMTPRERREREDQIKEHSKLSADTVYDVIRHSGEEELERTNRSLFYSGVAAGIVISFSVLAEAILRTYLPDAPYSYLIENIGYSLGFLMVIVGRMQLFTENTITTVLPFLARPSWRMGQRILELWGLVLFANLIGAFAIATLYAHSGAISDAFQPALMELSHHATHMGAWTSFVRAIPAGILIAAIVWMLPEGGTSQVAIIVLFTWLIAAGDFAHIVAGSVEMAFLVVQGELGFGGAVFGFFLPVLAGNIIGGTAIFATLAYGQVRDEVH